MRRTLFSTTVLAFALVAMTTIANAQQPVLITYQGYLTDAAGDPVADGLYDIEVALFPDSTGGEPFHIESFFNVNTSNGYWLIKARPATADLSWPVFIEIRVEGEVMAPRQQITHAPFAAIAQRVEGDILTAPGVLEIAPPDPCEPPEDCPPAIALSSDGANNIVKVNWPEPQGMTSSAIEIANVGNTGSKIWMYHPEADPPGPMIEINADPINGSSIVIHSAEPLLGEGGKIAGTSTIGAIITLNTNPAPHEEIPVIEMSSESPDGGTFKMFNPEVEPPPVLLEMNTSFNSRELGANFIMFNPSLEYSVEPLVEMSTGISTGARGTGASLVMFNPQPEPPGNDPFIEMLTHDLGGSFNMYAPQVGSESQLLLEIKADMDGAERGTGASLVMFNPQPEPPGNDPFIEMLTHDLGGSFNMYAPRAGLESRLLLEIKTDFDGAEIALGNSDLRSQLLSITANNTAASIKLFDTGGGTTVEISNDGDIEAKRGNFGSGNTLTGSSAFVAGSLNNVSGQEAFAVGESNTVDGFRATILGGDNNTASGMRSTVCGGSNNSVFGTSAVIPGGYGSTINSTAHYSCLIGIDASLSEDSTFMVDMPHIKFGNETNGYEFPTDDGSRDQILSTDGSGQLSWISLPSVASAGNRQLLEIINELSTKVDRLESKIAELEGNNINR